MCSGPGVIYGGQVGDGQHRPKSGSTWKSLGQRARTVAQGQRGACGRLQRKRHDQVCGLEGLY